jgi:hypothetical protein
MSVELQEVAGGQILVAKLTGKLVRADYQHFILKVGGLIRQHGKIRVLVEMYKFRGWSMGALWEDFKFDREHFRDIERLALVGDRRWEASMAAFCRPFTTAAVRYFDESEGDAAFCWITQGVREPAYAWDEKRRVACGG